MCPGSFGKAYKPLPAAAHQFQLEGFSLPSPVASAVTFQRLNDGFDICFTDFRTMNVRPRGMYQAGQISI